MRKNFAWNVVFAVAFLLIIGAEALTMLTVYKLDMLPNLYLAVFSGVMALLAVGIGLMLFVPGKSYKGRRIAACILGLLLLCGCAVIVTVATDVMYTLEATNQEISETTTREIYVHTEDPAQSLQDAAGYTFAYVENYDASCTQQVLDTLGREFGQPAVTCSYPDVLSMIEGFLNGETDAMILNAGYMSLIEDMEQFRDFDAKARILSQIAVTEPEEMLPAFTEPTEPPTEETEPTEETVPEETEPAVELDPFIVYISGSDSHSELIETGRNDVNILAVVNPTTKQVLLINTPRDYYVTTTVGGGALDKLTHCGIYGIKCSMNTLGNLYNEKVEYYVRLNFTGFKKLIDAMGGITVHSDYAFTAIQRTEIKEGLNELDGQQALDFARERYTLQGGDNERGKHQMQVIKAVIEKATSGTTIISNYSDIMASIEGMFSMNISSELVGDLMKMQLQDMASWNIVTYSVTGQNSMEECYSMPGMELAVVLPKESSVRSATKLIDMVFAGEILTEEAVNSVT